MAKIQETRNMSGKPAGEIYEAILKATPTAGFEVWKRRDIAWLVMVRRSEGDINGSVSVSPGGQVIVALNAPGMTEAEVNALAETYFKAIEAAL